MEGRRENVETSASPFSYAVSPLREVDSQGARGSKWTPRAIFCCPVVF